MEKAKQFSKYGGVAAGSAITDYTAFSILLLSGVGPISAQMTARIAGGVFSFFINKYWSFDASGKGNLKTEGRRFLILYVFSYLLALTILYLLTEQLGINPYPAKITADITSFIINFLVMRSYVFGGGKGLRYKLRKAFSGSGKTV